ncbi:hypothetical protein D3C78_489710 [compost metagenome]
MILQPLGGGRHAPGSKVGRGAQHPHLAAGEATGHQRRIRLLPEPQGDIDAGRDEIDVAIIQQDLELQPGVIPEKIRQVRDDVQAGEGDGRAHPQATTQASPALLHHGVGLVDLRQYLPGAPIIGLPRLGGGQTTGRAQQQAAAKTLLQLGNQLGDSGLTQPQPTPHRREGAGLHRQHEDLHHPQSIHPSLPCPSLPGGVSPCAAGIQWHKVTSRPLDRTPRVGSLPSSSVS